MAVVDINDLIRELKACTLCVAHLPHGPRPVFSIHPDARILIAGQAPGRRVHATGIPFNDPSGVRLRDWMGVDSNMFYDETKIAFLPMGFCYPGTGKSGDLPPRPECAIAWRTRTLQHLPKLELILAIGQYAQDWHMTDSGHKTLTERVQNWRKFWPTVIPLPHPSPRNNMWLRRNPWFETDVLPPLKVRVADLLKSD